MFPIYVFIHLVLMFVLLCHLPPLLKATFIDLYRIVYMDEIC